MDMAMRLRESSLVETKEWELAPAGLTIREGAGIAHKRRFGFADIACVLQTRDGAQLSVQVGQEVFSINVKPGDAGDALVIAGLVASVRRAQVAVNSGGA